jgi:hypothetical protein
VLLPYRLNNRISAAQALPQTDHGWAVQHTSWNNGKMDNWLPAHRAADGDDIGPYTMGYLTREDIPFQYALADASGSPRPASAGGSITTRARSPGSPRSSTSSSTTTPSPATICTRRP